MLSANELMWNDFWSIFEWSSWLCHFLKTSKDFSILVDSLSSLWVNIQRPSKTLASLLIPRLHWTHWIISIVTIFHLIWRELLQPTICYPSIDLPSSSSSPSEHISNHDSTKSSTFKSAVLPSFNEYHSSWLVHHHKVHPTVHLILVLPSHHKHPRSSRLVLPRSRSF